MQLGWCDARFDEWKSVAGRRNFEIMRKDVSAAHSAADTWGSISLRCRANKGRSACSHPSYSMPHKERSRLLLLIIALPHLERARVLACLQKSQAMRRSTLPPPVAPRRLRRTLSSYDEVRQHACRRRRRVLRWQTLSSADLSSTDPSTRHRHRSAFSPPTLLRPGRRVADGAGADDVQATAGAVGAGGAGVAQRASARVGTGRKSAGSSLSRTQQRRLWRFQLHCNSKPRSPWTTARGARVAHRRALPAPTRARRNIRPCLSDNS